MVTDHLHTAYQSNFLTLKPLFSFSRIGMIRAASRKSAGIPISQFDAMIAAITRSQEATLVTHNTKDFVNCGITIIDPWRT
ncbi:hypothetical protein IHE32_13770 (plasmid) [Mycetohabitans rhizoxinica]